MSKPLKLLMPDSETGQSARKKINIAIEELNHSSKRGRPVANITELEGILNPEDFEIRLVKDTKEQYVFEKGANSGDQADTNQTGFWVIYKGEKGDKGPKGAKGAKGPKGEDLVAGNSFVYVDKGNKSFNNKAARQLMISNTYTINHKKKIELGLNIPTRHDGQDWGGLYVNTNIEVNGTWYNLGNEGYGGASMSYKASTIATYVSSKVLDITKHLNLTADYTLRVELTARTYSGWTLVNKSHDINTTSNGLGSRGALQTWASDQNYATIYIKEIN